MKAATQMVLGICLIILMAVKQLPIPGAEILMSLQSFSIALLVITLGGRAVWVVMLYLILASFGLPIIAAGAANAYWYTSPLAGYYFGFLISSVILPQVLNRFKPEVLRNIWLCFAANESVILVSGFSWLSYNWGLSQAWWVGVYPYLFGAILKISFAALLYKYHRAIFKTSTILN